MNQEHELTSMVFQAQKNIQAADDLVRKYLPYIKSETAKFLHRPPVEGEDDELGIAMFAFHEAALAYRRGRGSFLSLASTAIRNRLIDYARKEQRHTSTISYDQSVSSDGEEDRTLLNQLDSGKNDIEEQQSRNATREELLLFAEDLKQFQLNISDIAENCPKQDRTLQACHKVLDYARTTPEIFEQMLKTKRLPVNALAKGSGIPKKTLERHRKYLIAILLAYTNGFEIIRGHLGQITLRKGVTNA